MLHAFPEERRAGNIIGHDETIAADDESFWSVVRGQFILGTEPPHLATVPRDRRRMPWRTR